jgi:biopolymer transport protein ExbD
MNRMLRSTTFPLVGFGVGLCVLLAFWVTTPLHVSGPPTVLLPKTDQPPSIEPLAGDVVVTVWPLGKCAIGRQIVSCADLGSRLTPLAERHERRVLVRGDERASYGRDPFGSRVCTQQWRSKRRAGHEASTDRVSAA